MKDIENNTNDNGVFDTAQSSNTNPENSQIDSTTDLNLDQNILQPVSEVEIAPSTESGPTGPKKKSHGKLIALLIVIAVLLIGSVTAYAKRNTLVNTLAITVKTPTDYYAYVEQKGLGSSIDALSSAYDKSLTQYAALTKEGVAQEVNLKLTIDPTFSSQLGLGNFQSIDAKLASLSKEGNSKTNIGLSYNDTSLISMDTYVKEDTNDLYLQIPELSTAYLLLSLNELMDETSTVTGSTPYNFTFADIQAFIENETLSPETLNSLLKKYASIIINNIDDVKLDKDIVLDASEISSSYSKLTAELNQEDLYNIAMAILKEAKNDKEIIKLCISLDICTEEEYTLAVDSTITDLTSNKQTMLDAAESVFMNVYVDEAGRIMGREFVSNSEETTNSLGYYITKKGTEFGFTAWVSEDDVNLFEFTGNATYSKDGYTGTSDLTYSQYDAVYSDYTTYSFNIAFENTNIVEKNGYLNGKYTITSDLLTGMELIFDCTADEKQQKIVFDLLYGDQKTANIEILCKEGIYQDFELPADTDEVYDGLTELEAYIATVDYESFIAKLEESLQIDGLGSYIESFISSYMN